MRVKPDLRIRKFVGKSVRLIVKMNGALSLSYPGVLRHRGRNEYGITLASDNVVGGTYCNFRASDIAKVWHQVDSATDIALVTKNFKTEK